MTTEAQRRAISKYHKKMRAFTVRFAKDSPEWKELEKHEEKTGYIRDLILKDIADKDDRPMEG